MSAGRLVWSDLPAYPYPGRVPEVKRQIVERTLTGSGIRAMARVRQGRSHQGNPRIKKKAGARSHVPTAVVEGGCPAASTVAVRRGEAAEGDERWRGGKSKAHQRWLWHAIDHLTGVVLAYVFGSRAAEVVVELHQLLQPFGLVPFYTAAAGVYDRPLPATAHRGGQNPPPTD